MRARAALALLVLVLAVVAVWRFGRDRGHAPRRPVDASAAAAPPAGADHAPARGPTRDRRAPGAGRLRAAPAVAIGERAAVLDRAAPAPMVAIDERAAVLDLAATVLTTLDDAGLAARAFAAEELGLDEPTRLAIEAAVEDFDQRFDALAAAGDHVGQDVIADMAAGRTDPLRELLGDRYDAYQRAYRERYLTLARELPLE